MSRRRRRPVRRLYRLRPAGQTPTPSEPARTEDENVAEAQRLVDALRREVDELADVVARFRRFVDIPPEFLREQRTAPDAPTGAPKSADRPERGLG